MEVGQELKAISRRLSEHGDWVLYSSISSHPLGNVILPIGTWELEQGQPDRGNTYPFARNHDHGSGREK